MSSMSIIFTSTYAQKLKMLTSGVIKDRKKSTKMMEKKKILIQKELSKIVAEKKSILKKIQTRKTSSNLLFDQLSRQCALFNNIIPTSTIQTCRDNIEQLGVLLRKTEEHIEDAELLNTQERIANDTLRNITQDIGTDAKAIPGIIEDKKKYESFFDETFEQVKCIICTELSKQYIYSFCRASIPHHICEEDKTRMIASLGGILEYCPICREPSIIKRFFFWPFFVCCMSKKFLF